MLNWTCGSHAGFFHASLWLEHVVHYCTSPKTIWGVHCSPLPWLLSSFRNLSHLPKFCCETNLPNEFQKPWDPRWLIQVVPLRDCLAASHSTQCWNCWNENRTTPPLWVQDKRWDGLPLDSKIPPVFYPCEDGPMAKAMETLNTKWCLVTNNVISFFPGTLWDRCITIPMRNTLNFPKWDLSLESWFFTCSSQDLGHCVWAGSCPMVVGSQDHIH